MYNPNYYNEVRYHPRCNVREGHYRTRSSYRSPPTGSPRMGIIRSPPREFPRMGIMRSPPPEFPRIRSPYSSGPPVSQDRRRHCPGSSWGDSNYEYPASRRQSVYHYNQDRSVAQDTNISSYSFDRRNGSGRYGTNRSPPEQVSRRGHFTYHNHSPEASPHEIPNWHSVPYFNKRMFDKGNKRGRNNQNLQELKQQPMERHESSEKGSRRDSKEATLSLSYHQERTQENLTVGETVKEAADDIVDHKGTMLDKTQQMSACSNRAETQLPGTHCSTQKISGLTKGALLPTPAVESGQKCPTILSSAKGRDKQNTSDKMSKGQTKNLAKTAALLKERASICDEMENDNLSTNSVVKHSECGIESSNLATKPEVTDFEKKGKNTAGKSTVDEDDCKIEKNVKLVVVLSDCEKERKSLLTKIKPRNNSDLLDDITHHPPNNQRVELADGDTCKKANQCKTNELIEAAERKDGKLQVEDSSNTGCGLLNQTVKPAGTRDDCPTAQDSETSHSLGKLVLEPVSTNKPNNDCCRAGKDENSHSLRLTVSKSSSNSNPKKDIPEQLESGASHSILKMAGNKDSKNDILEGQLDSVDVKQHSSDSNSFKDGEMSSDTSLTLSAMCCKSEMLLKDVTVCPSNRTVSDVTDICMSSNERVRGQNDPFECIKTEMIDNCSNKGVETRMSDETNPASGTSVVVPDLKISGPIRKNFKAEKHEAVGYDISEMKYSEIGKEMVSGMKEMLTHEERFDCKEKTAVVKNKENTNGEGNQSLESKNFDKNHQSTGKIFTIRQDSAEPQPKAESQFLSSSQTKTLVVDSEKVTMADISRKKDNAVNAGITETDLERSSDRSYHMSPQRSEPQRHGSDSFQVSSSSSHSREHHHSGHDSGKCQVSVQAHSDQQCCATHVVSLPSVVSSESPSISSEQESPDISENGVSVESTDTNCNKREPNRRSADAQTERSGSTKKSPHQKSSHRAERERHRSGSSQRSSSSAHQEHQLSSSVQKSNPSTRPSESSMTASLEKTCVIKDQKNPDTSNATDTDVFGSLHRLHHHKSSGHRSERERHGSGSSQSSSSSSHSRKRHYSGHSKRYRERHLSPVVMLSDIGSELSESNKFKALENRSIGLEQDSPNLSGKSTSLDAEMRESSQKSHHRISSHRSERERHGSGSSQGSSCSHNRKHLQSRHSHGSLERHHSHDSSQEKQDSTYSGSLRKVRHSSCSSAKDADPCSEGQKSLGRGPLEAEGTPTKRKVTGETQSTEEAQSNKMEAEETPSIHKSNLDVENKKKDSDVIRSTQKSIVLLPETTSKRKEEENEFVRKSSLMLEKMPTKTKETEGIQSAKKSPVVYRIRHKPGSTSSMEYVSPLSNLESPYRGILECQDTRRREGSQVTAVLENDEELDQMDSDSDDSILDTVPVFLQTLQAASASCAVEEPQQELEHSDDGSDSKGADLFQSLRSQNYKFSLDSLLTEKIEKEESNLELEAMQEELKEGIRQGGFVRLAGEAELTEDSEILPEQQQQLQRLAVSEQKIVEVHPGVKVFHSEHYKHLFTENLSVSSCGFSPGNSYIDEFLASVQPEGLCDFLTSNILSLTFEKVSCPDAVLTWLFYIMSIHTSRLVVESCRQDLAEIIVRQQEFTSEPVSWCPSLTAILRVLMNYGASLSALCKDTSLLGMTEREMRELETPLEEDDQENRPPNMIPPNNGTLNRENFRQVIQVIAVGLKGRPKISNSELIALALVLCNVALDKTLVSQMLHHDFQVCLACLLQKFSENEWSKQAEVLCNHLASLTSHHHNKVYLVELLPFTTRGHYIQRRLSYVLLCGMLDLRQQCQDLHQFKVDYLNVMVPKMRELVQSDLYLLSSVITLVDRCVGKEILKLSEKNALRALTDAVRTLTGEVRDNVSMLDRTKVKDVMVRLTSTWTFMMQSMGSKQPSLFAWKGDVGAKVKVETVRPQSDSGSDVEDESENASTNDVDMLIT